jgi:enoyl-CoA hydratase/carnithine racemase
MIQIQDHGPAIRELRLDRPPANALSPDLITALAEAVRAASGDGMRALILSGSPGRFSGGLDVPLLVDLDRAATSAVWGSFYDLMQALAASDIPIAAAITGHAPAGGTVLPLFCDWRGVAAGDWRLGLNEVQVGIALPPVIHRVLRRQIGARQAERLAVGGVLISPEEALRIGLVDEIVPAESLVQRAIEWCQGMLALPAAAMAVTRRRARADLVGLLEEDAGGEVEKVVESWWSDETQKVLRELVERLRKKKTG